MMRVLVVDGEKRDRQAIVEALVEMDGVAVQGAVPDVQSALRAIAECAPDIVVTGTSLADAEGMQLVEAVRKRERSPSIVVIGRDTSREDWKRHLEAGADRFVECDPGFDELRDVVGALANRPKPSQADVTLKVIGRMAVGVAHEVSVQLSSIGMTLAMLERAPNDRHLWADAHSAIEQTSRLVSTLLGYVPGQRPGAMQLDLATIVRQALARAAKLIAPNVTVDVEIRGGVQPIRGIANEIEQLVIDLLLDANDAMPDGGQLSVRLAPTAASAVMLELSHTGSFVEHGARHEVMMAILRRHNAVMRTSRREPAGAVTRVMIPV